MLACTRSQKQSVCAENLRDTTLEARQRGDSF